ncbi:MAG: glycosyltransferase family 4 protein [bacterium]|nr:glycosyltransferase family 4 protein [bacterium]
MKKKVLVVTSEFPRWENDSTKPSYFFELCQHLARFFAVSVVTPHEFCASKQQCFTQVNVTRFQYFWPSKWQVLYHQENESATFLWNVFRIIQAPFFLIAECNALIRIILSEKCDIVVTHNFFPHSMLYAILNFFLKIPQVLIIDTSESMLLKKKSFFLNYMIANILNLAKCVILHNAYIRYCLEKITKKPFHHKIIPQGINSLPFTRIAHTSKIQQALDLPRDKKIFLFIGKLTCSHGIHILLEAANLLRKQYDNFILLVFANGPLKRTINKWIKQQNMEHIVFFSHLYDRSFLPDYFALSDALVIPSIVDEDGYTDVSTELILQGLSAGVPIIASRIADITNPLKDGCNGWLFEQGKYGDLAEKMKIILQEKPLKTIKKNAQSSIKEYSWDIIAHDLYQTINQLFFYHKK